MYDQPFIFHVWKSTMQKIANDPHKYYMAITGQVLETLLVS